MEEHNYKSIPHNLRFSLILLFISFLAQAVTAYRPPPNNLYSAIYYGDSIVDVGESFSITCIISISDAIDWVKDGQPIRKQNNVRHNRDDFIFNEVTNDDLDAQGFLSPNYDNPSRKAKFFDDRIRHPLVLMCNITGGGTYNMTWTRNGVDVSLDTQLKDRVQVYSNESKLIIENTDVLDAGQYECLIPGHKEIINVIANIYFKKIHDHTAVVEGETLRIHCIAYGTDPTITWRIGNVTYDKSDGRVILSSDENNITNAILTIENVILSDRNYYNCSGVNLASLSGAFDAGEEGTYVRVKGKLAALWPFLGICAEVFILCAIILIYEKRRNKSEPDESDTDQSPEHYGTFIQTSKTTSSLSSSSPVREKLKTGKQ